MNWDKLKVGFYRWEDSTAQILEKVVKSPMLLGPSGTVLGTAMRVKAVYHRTVSGFVGSFGLATKRDQERTLHTLNQLESRMIDLEERLIHLLPAARGLRGSAPCPPVIDALADNQNQKQSQG